MHQESRPTREYGAPDLLILPPEVIVRTPAPEVAPARGRCANCLQPFKVGERSRHVRTLSVQAQSAVPYEHVECPE